MSEQNTEAPKQGRKASPEVALRKAEKEIEKIDSKLVKARERQTKANGEVTDLENERLAALAEADRIRNERVQALQAELERYQRAE